MELVAFKSEAAFAKHHVTVTRCLAFEATAVEMDGRVMIALMVSYIKVYTCIERYKRNVLSSEARNISQR